MKHFKMYWPYYVFSAIILAAVLVLAIPVRKAMAQEVEVGEGLVCDTPEEVATFAETFDGDADKTLAAVNQKEVVCAILNVAYIKGGEVKKVKDWKGEVSVVEVIVVGLKAGEWREVNPVIKFIAVRVPGESI